MVSRLDDAHDRLLEAFDLDSDVDLNTFDHYAEIEQNNPIAPAVLLANVRLANAMNIPESIVSEAAGLEEGQTTFEFGKLSRLLFIQLAQMIADGSGEADLQNMIEEALPIACNSLNLEGAPEPEEVGYMISIIGNADPLNLVEEQAGEINATIIEASQFWLKKNLFDILEKKISDILFIFRLTKFISR